MLMVMSMTTDDNVECNNNNNNDDYDDKDDYHESNDHYDYENATTANHAGI